MNLYRKILYILIGVFIAGGIFLSLWKIPQWQAASYHDKIAHKLESLEPKEYITAIKDIESHENTARTTLAQIIGGIAFLVGLFLTYKNIRVTEEGKLTDRFSTAVELLGSDAMDVRLGGIHALERIARDSQKDHWTVMEILSGFARENSHKKLDSKRGVSPREDVLTILTVIARRKWRETETRQINLQGANLSRYVLAGLDLSKVNLSRANLSKADLSGTNLNEAVLNEAILNEAFSKIDDPNEIFEKYRVKLRGAKLRKAKLHGAILSAYFNNADLTHAEMLKADLWGAKFIGADLSHAIFDGANLGSADFKDANIFGTTFIEALMHKTKLHEANRVMLANFRGAKMEGANLIKVIFLTCNFTDAAFAGEGAYPQFADIDHSNFMTCDSITLDQILTAQNYETAKLPPGLAAELEHKKALAKNPAPAEEKTGAATAKE